jgi:DNA repair photolyase
MIDFHQQVWPGGKTVTLERRSRKGPILTPSSLSCLRGLPTINITEGCSHGCTYCYTQGYTNYPGAGRVVLFENTAQLVRDELRRKRRRPRRVYFSPSSDAFQPLPEVREITFQTMSVLLDAGIEVAFLTKGSVDERFLKLFAANSSLVHAQIGITTLDQGLWQAFEPHSAPPRERLESIGGLKNIGVAVSARLDPLIPDVTDTDQNLEPLLAELAARQISSVAASYLFLRPAFLRRLSDQMREHAKGQVSIDDWSRRTLADGQGGGLAMSTQDRAERFSRIKEMAKRHGIEVHVCTCKNPDLPGPGCQIAGPPMAVDPTKEPTLFS